MKRFLLLGLILVILTATLSACQLYTQDYREDVLEYAMISDDGDFSLLDQYPNLEYVDLRGSTCYEQILKYASAHPNVTVRYNVQLGNKRYNEDITEITLNGYETSYELLLQNLKYLPKLRSVHLNQNTLTKEEQDTLIAAYPEISFSYTVELCGRQYDCTVSELDLAHMTSGDLEQAVHAIALLPDVGYVDLANEIGESNLSMEDLKLLQSSFPNIVFRYEFNLFGQKVSTAAEELVFDSVKIGNDGVTQIREVLSVMPRCRYVLLDSCDIDNEVMAQLREDYPEIEVVWRVFAGGYSILTNEEMLRMNTNLRSSDGPILSYCNKIKYLDVSNTSISDIGFVANMPDLEIAIFTMTKVKDISPLANCPNLVWVELSGCYSLNDVSALSGHRNLKYLNVSNTKVSNIDVLKDVPLERFNCVKSSVKKDALDAFVNQHPECLTVSTGSATGYGWRYNDKAQREPFEYYLFIREVFRMDDRTFRGNRKES